MYGNSAISFTLPCTDNFTMIYDTRMGHGRARSPIFHSPRGPSSLFTPLLHSRILASTHTYTYNSLRLDIPCVAQTYMYVLVYIMKVVKFSHTSNLICHIPSTTYYVPIWLARTVYDPRERRSHGKKIGLRQHITGYRRKFCIST